MKTYFIDTNYILRLLLRDNNDQYREVYSLFQKAIKGEVLLYSSIIVFFEINWVLSSSYEKDKKECVKYLEDILKIKLIEFENQNLLSDSLEIYSQKNISLEDSYNTAYFHANDFQIFATFDKKLLNNLDGV